MKYSIVENSYGDKKYYLNNLLHREDGPAIEYADGWKEWYQHGKLHRSDGPAIERPDGFKTWYFHGKYIDCNSQDEFLSIIIFS
jgi:hypothetical protein